MSDDKSTRKKKKQRSSTLYFLSGGVLKEDFIAKNAKMIVLIVVLMLLFISNRYICLSKLREIDRLQRELRDVKNRSISIASQLTGSNRISQIEDLVKAYNLGLEMPEDPPFVLKK